MSKEKQYLESSKNPMNKVRALRTRMERGEVDSLSYALEVKQILRGEP